MKPKRLVDYILWVLWIGLAFIAVILAVGIQNSEQKDIGPLISSMAILLSAAVASASIMKNITETKVNEEIKHQKDEEKSLKEKERKRIFTLNVMKTIQVTLGIFSEKASINTAGYAFVPNYDSQFDFESDIQIVGKLINSIFCESILPYITNKEQEIISNFYIEYNRFLATKNEAEQNYPMVQANVTSTQTKLLEYSKLFSDFTQSYIDLNTKP